MGRREPLFGRDGLPAARHQRGVPRSGDYGAPDILDFDGGLVYI